MNYYRLTKKVIPNMDNWTAVSDIGKQFGNSVLSKEIYVDVENKCLNVIKEFVSNSGYENFEVLSFEDYRRGDTDSDRKFGLENYDLEIDKGSVLDINQVVAVSKMCLREIFWVKLGVVSSIYITFGHDFKVLLGCEKPISVDVNTLNTGGLQLCRLEKDPLA